MPPAKKRTLLILAGAHRWVGKEENFVELRLPSNKNASNIIIRKSEQLLSPEQEPQGLQIVYTYSDSAFAQRLEEYHAVQHFKKTIQELEFAVQQAESARHDLENSTENVPEEDLRFAAHECRLLKRTLAQKQENKTIDCSLHQTTTKIEVHCDSVIQFTQGPYPLLISLTSFPQRLVTESKVEKITHTVPVLSRGDCIPTEFPTVFSLAEEKDKTKGLLCMSNSRLMGYTACTLWGYKCHDGTITKRKIHSFSQEIRSISVLEDFLYVSITKQKLVDIYSVDEQQPMGSKLVLLDSVGQYDHYRGKRHHNIGEMKAPTFVGKTNATMFIIDPPLKRLQLFSLQGEWKKQVKLPANCGAAGLAFSQSMVYLCDTCNHAVYAFNDNGILCRTFKVDKSLGGEDWTPITCAMSRGCLTVLDGSGEFFHFNLEGELLRKDKSLLSCLPGSMATDVSTGVVWIHSGVKIFKYH